MELNIVNGKVIIKKQNFKQQNMQQHQKFQSETKTQTHTTYTIEENNIEQKIRHYLTMKISLIAIIVFKTNRYEMK